MRLDPHAPEERIVREAVQRAVDTAKPARFSGAGGGAFVAPPGSATTPATLDDGSIGTNHPFILGLDALNDQTAWLQVPSGDA